MKHLTSQYSFRSTRFEIDPREDEETNPFMYGRSVAQWLRAQFVAIGYDAEECSPKTGAGA
jgi:hypothetical protein